MSRASKPVTVTLGGHYDRVVARVTSGEYASVSEVVREGLRALDRQEEILNGWLKAKVAESLADPEPDIPIDEVFADLRAHHDERVRREGEDR